MSTLLQSKDKLTESLGICADCKKPTDAKASSYDDEDKIICDNCDEHYAWCEVCQTHNYSDFQSPCRHLFWNEDGEWAGFGVYQDDWHYGKAPFLAMLELTGVEFAIELRRSLLAHKYYFQFQGSIFGVESIFAQLLQEDGKMSFEWNCPLNQVFKEEDSEKQQLAATGVSWLMSLWSGSEHNGWSEPKTEAADLMAAGWCDEFIGAVAQ